MTDVNDVSPTAPPNPWRWLLELREHLVPALEIVTPDGEALLPLPRGEFGDRLRRVLTRPVAPVLRIVLREAWRHSQSRTPFFTQTDGLRLAALGLTSAGGSRIVLLLAERVDAGRESTRRADLTRMAAWLARALASTTATTSVRDWHEVTVLHQVLQRAMTSGSMSAVIHAYVDALAIWADINTRAYLGNRAGRFVLEVALAGARRDEAPRSLPADALAPLRARRALTALEASYYGFTGADAVIVSPIQLPRCPPWLLVYAGRFSPAEAERLALFEEMLIPALSAASEVEASRLTWMLMQPLADRRLTPLDAATRALTELESTALCSAALQVRHRRGGVRLALGPPVPAGSHGSQWPGHAVQRLALDVTPPHEATLTIWRPPDRPFTQRELQLARTSAALLAAWTVDAIARGAFADEVSPGGDGPERRRPHGDPLDVSLLVILPDRADTAPDVRNGWLDGVRQHVRPADVVGAVKTGDISVLLPSTPEVDAQAVATRLARLFAQHSSLALLDGAPIAVVGARRPSHRGPGAASRPPHAPN